MLIFQGFVVMDFTLGYFSKYEIRYVNMENFAVPFIGIFNVMLGIRSCNWMG